MTQGRNRWRRAKGAERGAILPTPHAGRLYQMTKHSGPTKHRFITQVRLMQERNRSNLNSIVSKICIFVKTALKEKVKYWIDLSDYDFETAEVMLSSRRYLYVGFMCHQSVEKILKAYFYSIYDEPSPYSHNLSFLPDKSGLYELIPENFKEFINLLEPLNIEASYPTHKKQLLKSLTKNRCEGILTNTKELQTWVKERL